MLPRLVFFGGEGEIWNLVKWLKLYNIYRRVISTDFSVTTLWQQNRFFWLFFRCWQRWFIELLRRFSHGSFAEICIDVHGGWQLFVTNDFLNRLGIHIVLKGYRGKRVAQLMGGAFHSRLLPKIFRQSDISSVRERSLSVIRYDIVVCLSRLDCEQKFF